MKKARRRRSVVSLIVGLSLLLQMLVPIWSFTPPVSAAPLPAPAAGITGAATALDGPASASTEPTILVQPLSVSRVQSRFADAGAPVEITYTVRNNLSPQQPLDIPDDATIEEKIAALAAYDVTADPHTLRNVILVVSPTAESMIVAASHPADVDGGNHVFMLDNLPPQVSVTIAVTAATPASVSVPTLLVNATGWASLNGQAHSATSAPALILPAALGDWLMPTIDANSEDIEMLQALAQIGSDPELIFGFVRGLDYEAYRGSLRGTRGTLWAEAGNSLDLSSLLIAMLRASGVPARYRHGRLSEANAQTLIASMFPTPTAILGRVSPELPVSDPVNDPGIIAIVQDHWWVEAYIDGTWTNLDPSFAGASVGDLFASEIAADGTDRIAELTDDHRHLVTIRLDVETYNQLNLGGQPTRNTHLDHTFRVVEVATSSVTFANHVTSEGQGGLVYANTIHTYAPFLHIEDLDQIIWGESYQELLTNFPLATTFITGAWLSFEITHLDGVVTTYERTLRDRLGYDTRTYGGTPDITIDGGSPGIFSEFDIYSISLFPGTVPTAVYEIRRASMTGTLSQLATDAQRMQGLVDLEPLSIELQTEAAQLRARYQLNLSFFLNAISMSFAEAAGRASRSTQDALYVKAYHDSPRLIIVSHEISDNVAQLNVDLRTTLERTIAYPGQGVPATFAFNLFKGINESWLEGEVLDAAAGAEVQTTAVVMQAAHDQGIPFVYVSKANLDLLPDLDLTAEAMARITRAVLEGKLVNLPTAAPLINEEPAMGWWEIDPNTGETIGVMENGLHSALIEYVGNLLFGTTVGRIADFMIGATAATYDFLGKQVFKATGSGDFGTPAQDALGTSGQGIACLMADALGCLGIGKGYLDYGYMAMEALLNYLDTNDPPLPDLLIGNTVITTPLTSVDTVLTVPATLGGSSITADVESDFAQIEEADGGLSFYAGALERLASGSSGQKTAINHVNSTNLTLAAAKLQIAAPAGAVSITGVPIDAGAGVALADFSGTIDVATVNPSTDRIVLNGTGQLFTLAASPDTSSISPVEATTFDVVLASTFTDDFTATLFAPEGWHLDINTAGQVTATPPLGAAPGAYTLTLTARSETHPSLILTAEHTVTVTGYDGLTLTVSQDLLTTVPMGERRNDRSFINTGQAQVPGAAYIIELTNTANVGHTYTVSVTGLPDGWTLLGGVQDSSITLALPPGTASQIGLYVTPPNLPAAGTSYTIDVIATAENGLSASDSVNFVMPALAFSYVQVTPSTRATTATGSVVYDVTVSNIGNASGEFSLNVEVINFDESISFGPLPDPVNLLPEERVTFPITVSAESAPIFRKVQLEFSSPVPDTPYAPTANAELRIVSAQAEPILEGADLCEFTPGLQAAAYSVAAAVDELVYWCQQGDCPLPLRDQLVTAGQSFVLYARSNASPVSSVPGIPIVEAALATLSTQTTHSGILDAVTDLGTSIYDLSGELCQIQQHRLSARFSPYAAAVLPDETVSFDLEVTNRGTVTTTYAITVTGLPGGTVNFNETIDPGATTRLQISASSTALGSYDLEAEIVAIGPDVTLDIRRQVSARLNVVDKFVQVTSVTADPPFVETGTSATTLSVQVANLAGVAQAAQATLSVLAPDATLQFTAGIPLHILAGAPRSYDLVTVNTSGWAPGIYTITVELLDDQGALIPDGSGYGYLSVGQAVQFSQAVIPPIVAPGTVTVTTRITTELNTQFLPSANPEITSTEPSQRFTLYDAPYWEVEQAPRSSESPQPTRNAEATVTGPPLPSPSARELEETSSRPLSDETLATPLAFDHTATPTTPEATVASLTEEDISSLPLISQVTFSGFTRTEQDDPAITYEGTWTNHTTSRASGGSYWRNATAGSSAAFAFEGEWLSIGFMGSNWGGFVEIAIDDESQGTFDLYRREDNTPIALIFDDLGPGPHTVSITVAGSSNPFASGTRVELDYIDVRDGIPLGDGTFEENDVRVLRSAGWVTVTHADASGGSYIRGGSVTAWFPFDGDSFTYQALAYNGANRARLYVDGQYLDTVDLYHPNSIGSAITRTFSYAGFGPGPHLLQINAYRSQTTLDAITTPGEAPFIDPNPPTIGITRFEEDHPAIRYNGVPYLQTAQSWNRVDSITSNRASDGQYLYSAAAGDTISFDFEGPWIGVGFATDRFGGQAVIAIDGALMTEVDLYSREGDTESFYFDNLGAGWHTITITVLDTRHSNALNSRIYFDYFDVWDGQPLVEGTFEETDERIFYSNGWSRVVNAEASGGGFASSGSSDSTAWFPFTGDSVTVQAWTAGSYHSLELKIDGISLGHFNTYSFEAGPRAFSFEGLGDGPHVLEVRKYRNNAAVDAFTTPATGEHYELPPSNGVIRMEEDHPDLRYNGYPFRTMPTAWSSESTLNDSSGQFNARTGTAGDTLSLEFEGTWVGVGFRSASWSGVAEIFIDGVSRGTVDTAGFTGGIMSVYYDDLPPGTHVISVTAVSGTVMPDFIDIWDGQPLTDGWYNARLDDYSGRFHYSNKGWWGQYENVYAYGGDFVRQNLINANPNIWLTFVGNDLTLLTRNGNDALLDITIDGEHYGEFNLTAEFSNQPYALHFPDLGDGPHVVQIHTRNWGIIDAFEINPDGFYAFTPQITWHDPSGTEQLEGASGAGFLTTIGIGDLNGDGNVELVAPGVNGRLYVYRGDGQDTGDGTPILWTTDIVGPAAEPALADLTGDGQAEIIVSGRHGTFAFRHDGVLLWENPDVVSYYANEDLGWGGPTVGNLDHEPHPEIVIAASEDALYVLDHTGAIQWSDPIGVWPTVPVLADITGDGRLNIIVGQRWELRAYDYLNGAGELAWTYVQTDTTNYVRPGVFGAPAVADLTGDGRPEIIINWGHIIEALRYDGTSLWRYHTNDTRLYRPSAITVADVTGDGEVNIVTASAISAGFLIFDHLMMVLTADGTLVWQQTVADNTASASGVAAQDLTGDGVWEILWNGATDGFLIIRGSDGKRLFNEPFTRSGTIVEYPTMGDVDGDGVADVVVAGREGIFVISHIGRWMDSRPLWNQHNYHVTNINDDWSVPFTQPNSWELHNTYRTQTPERYPAPAYQMVFTYTEGAPNVTVLTTTASVPLTGTPPTYNWSYRQEWYQPVITTTFDSLLTDLEPGETRQVSAGTEISYRLPSGLNHLTLPPLYVTVPSLGDISPAAQSVAAGGTAVFTLTLTHPGSEAALYSLFPAGLPADWLTYPDSLLLEPGETAIATITVTIPTGSEPDTLVLWLDVVWTTESDSGTDSFEALLTVFQGVALSLSPAAQSGPTGQTLPYSLTVTNLEPEARSYGLTATGLAGVTLPAEIMVPGSSSETVQITATSHRAGPQPFTIEAEAPNGAGGSVEGVVTGEGRLGVRVSLAPATAVTGPGATAIYAVTVTNTGDTADSYALQVDAPAGWSVQLTRAGIPVTAIAIPPFLFNDAELLLWVTARATEQPGAYPISLTAQSLSQAETTAMAVATAEVGARGVQISISPSSQSVNPAAPTAWSVTVTNTGSLADTFDLEASGIPALAGTLGTPTVSLAPGASQTVSLVAPDLRFLVPGRYVFAVRAQSQVSNGISAQDEAVFTVPGFEEVAVSWDPADQAVSGTLSTDLLLIINNTGNLITEYQLNFSGEGLTVTSSVDRLSIPPGREAAIRVEITATMGGSYEVVGSAVSPAGTSGSATASLVFEFEDDNQPPVVNAGPDQFVDLGQLVQFSGSATDPDGDALISFEWDFGDGNTASGTLTPTHIYTVAGTYEVTLAVTDERGAIGTDSLQVRVKDDGPGGPDTARLHLPLIIHTP